MKRSDLIKVVRVAMKEVINTELRKVIKEEIALVIGNLVLEEKLNNNNNNNNGTAIPRTKTSKKKKRLTETLDLDGKVKKSLNSYKNELKHAYSSDNNINSLLQETAASMSPEDLKNFGTNTNANDVPSVLDDTDALPESLNKAINKDYSGMFTKKKKHYRP